MATDIVNIVGLAVDSRSVKEGTKSLDGLGKQAGKTEKATDKMSASLKRSAVAMGAMATAAAALAATKLLNVARSFDVMNASLVTVTGSTEAAAKAFSKIEQFAATTPFDLEQVANAFIKMKALGLDPSERALTDYGNTASAMGKSLNQMIEAVADAATGEFERIKEFGIKASSQGDRVKFTFRGVTTEIGKNSAEIERFLMNIGEVDFAGAMEQRANSLDGALSNLSDSWDGLFRTIAQSGASAIFKDLALQLSAAAEGANTLIKVLSNADEQSALAIQIQDTESEVRKIRKSIKEFETGDVSIWEKIFGTAAKDPVVELNNKLAELDGKLVGLRKRRQALLETPAETSALAAASGDPQGGATAKTQDEILNTIEIQMGQENAIKIQKIQEYYTRKNEIESFAALNEEERLVFNRERELAAFEERRAFLEDQGFTELEIKNVVRESELLATMNFEQRKAAIEDRAEAEKRRKMSEGQKFAQAISDGDYKQAITSAKKMSAGLARENKIAFEANKIATIAQIAIDGFEATSKAYKWGTTLGGPIGGAAAAAATAGWYMAQAQAAASASFGGGAGAPPSAGGTAGGVPSQQIAQAPAPVQPQQQQAQTVINLNGTFVDTQAFINDGLLPSLSDSINNSAVTFIDPQSAQGQLLAGA